MSPIVSAEIIAGALVLLALLTLAFIYIRRRRLSSGAPLMLCALRGYGQTQFRLGLLRFRGSTLEWFTLIGPSLRPARSWERPRLELEAPMTLKQPVAGLPEAVEVDCHYGTDTFAMALAPTAYTAMRSWLESAPPGFNVNVA